MRRIKECLSDGTYLLVLMLVGILVALIVFEKISPTPEGIDAEAVDKMSVAQNEVVAVQESQPQEELIIASDDLSQDVIERQNNGYYEALELLARVIHCENSNEVDGEEACWYTGSVIVNRIKSEKYPDTLEGVIYQKGQYDCLKALYKEEPTDIEWEVAAELLNSGSIIPDEVLYAAEFTQGSGTYDKIGRTIYSYE